MNPKPVIANRAYELLTGVGKQPLPRPVSNHGSPKLRPPADGHIVGANFSRKHDCEADKW